MSVERPHGFMHKGRVVYIEEGGLIPGSDQWHRAGSELLVHYDKPAISYFEPNGAGPRRRRWWGGHIRYRFPKETNPLEIHLGSRARAERWLRRAGQGRVLHPIILPLASA